MLVELRVRDLGVIEDLTLELGPGLTAVTGETGAGKTLVVEAIELLVGGRSDSSVVRAGGAEALVEAVFELDGKELVISRSMPASGRSRAWVDARTVPVASLSELGQSLVDIHGQHSHQALLSRAAQRDALDRFAGIDLAPLRELRSRIASIEKALQTAGGDGQSRLLEAEFLKFQLAELDAAGISDPEEDTVLAQDQERLANVEVLFHAATAAAELAEESRDTAARAELALRGHPVLAQLAGRLASNVAELEDVARELRREADGLESDPARLQAVQERRQALAQLRRKYGASSSASLAEVISYAERARARLAELASSQDRVAELERAHAQLSAQLVDLEKAVLYERQQAAPQLARLVEERLRTLAMERARMEVVIGPTGSPQEVEIRLGANPGEPVLPLSKVASGGELARIMLALRLVVPENSSSDQGACLPPTVVLDEVDAGIGGEAAVSVGRSIAELATAGKS